MDATTTTADTLRNAITARRYIPASYSVTWSTSHIKREPEHDVTERRGGPRSREGAEHVDSIADRRNPEHNGVQGRSRRIAGNVPQCLVRRAFRRNAKVLASPGNHSGSRRIAVAAATRTDPVRNTFANTRGHDR